MTIVGTIVQITSSFVLPWIGGPSRSSSPGRWRQRQMLKSIIATTATKIGTETITSTSQKVSIGGATSEPCSGNQLRASMKMMPITEATTIIASSTIQFFAVTAPR